MSLPLVDGRGALALGLWRVSVALSSRSAGTLLRTPGALVAIGLVRVAELILPESWR